MATRLSKKTINKKLLLSIDITVILLCIAMSNPIAVLRFVEAIGEFATSLVYYFAEFVAIGSGTDNPIQPTVTDISRYVSVEGMSVYTAEQWRQIFTNWGQSIVTPLNMLTYIAHLAQSSYLTVTVLLVLIPLLLLIGLLAKKLLFCPNKRPDCTDSKLLALHRRLHRRIYSPAIAHMRDYAVYVKAHRFLWVVWLALIAIALNIASLVLSLVGFLFYLISSWNIAAIFIEIYKLSVDTAYMLTLAPILFWIAIAIVILALLSKNKANKKLIELDSMTMDFVSEQDLVVFFVGTMGKGKTTAMSYASMLLEERFRNKALELLKENANKFVSFPWRLFEKDIEQQVAIGKITTLHSARKYINSQRLRYENNPVPSNIWQYDVSLYPLQYNGALKIESLWQVLESYARLYIIYDVDSSLIISNYAIRRTGTKETTGHFPDWDYDFTKAEPAPLTNEYSHILDYDTLRYGKTMDPLNAENNNEWGIVACTEIAKERGNKLTNAGTSKIADKCNSKNDYFNLSMAYKRHTSTIDGFPFANMLMDDQRPDRLESDAQQMTTILTIKDKSKPKSTLPFYWLIDMLHELLYEPLSSFYYDYRKVRSDNTVISSFVNFLQAAIHRHYTNITQLYGYVVLTIGVTDGLSQIVKKDSKMYICTKKIYSKVFATDCYTELLNRHADRSISLQSIDTYKDVLPTLGEFNKQHSRVIDDLMSITEKSDVPKRKTKKKDKTITVNSDAEECPQ